MLQDKKFKELTLPTLSWEGKVSEKYGELVVQPLEPGFGVTLGNALRRVMLSAIEGAAVTSVVIKGVNNEFSSMPGIVEDVVHVVLNIKSLVIKNETGMPGSMRLHVRGGDKRVATAADIVADSHLTILNKDLVIANIAVDGDLDINFTVEMGRGYVPAQWPQGQPLLSDGRIYVDASFSPVCRVEYHVEKTRVGDAIDYDKLRLAITTNGAADPRDVVHYATSVLRTQLEHFLSATEIPFNNLDMLSSQEEAGSMPVEADPTRGLPVELFLRPIDELEFSVRAHNCLISAGVRRVIDLVNLSDDDVLKIKNFGRKSLREVKEIIHAFGLHLGMNVKEIDLKRLIKEQEMNGSRS